MPRNFITDPEQLLDLEGQQYIVLRPTAAVMREFDAVQDAVRQQLGATVRYPGAGHVTLRGLHEPERRDDVRDLVREWAGHQVPIDIVFEAVDSFPAPWQIIVARLARTSSLLNSYSSLTAALDAGDLRRIGELPLEDWVFHLSVAYAGSLAAEEWAEVAARTRRRLTEPPVETISEVELVTYFDSTEHRKVFPLGSTVSVPPA